mmetsp:Transcript_50806/g.152949  ORF Transcript_50806/g.152949 Transcript_50806/m.152949 type:complete len:646 (-) Transcript_50806:26-1963(-)
MLVEEELGASFLITLKHRSVTPDLVDGASQCLADMLEPMEDLRKPSTGSTYNSGLVSSQKDLAERKNDTNHDHGSSSLGLHRPGVSFSMALPEDAHWLSDLQCYVRSSCCEFFVAGESDVKTSPSTSRRSNNSSSNGAGGGRRGRVSVGRVGIRCMFCRDLPSSARAAQSTSFPSQISGIYGAIVMMQCRHFNHCGMMPEDVRSTLEQIRGTRNTSPPPGSLPGEFGPSPPSSYNTPGRQQYWAESARRLGLIDTSDGIRLSSDNKQGGHQAVPSSDPVVVAFKPIVHTSACSAEVFNEQITAATSKIKKHALVTPDMSATSSEALKVPDLSLPSSLSSLMGDTFLVSAEDKDLVPDYLFLAMAQMKPCTLSESDRVGCYKDRGVGFVGMCCKHCGGQPGFGKYFPATVRSLAQTTTSQTIIKHVGVKCRLCPAEVRNAVLALQQNSHDKPGCNYSRGPSSANDGRPKYGSRKVFFQRVWGRLHGEAIPEIPDFEAEQAPSQPSASVVANKKRARPHPEEQRSDQVTVTPNDSDATLSEQGDNEGAGDVNGLGGGSSGAGLAQSNSVSEEESSSSSSDGDDERPLTDDRDRRVTVRAGGTRVSGRGAEGSRNRRCHVLPTKAGAKRKGVSDDAEYSSKRIRHFQL